MAKKASASTEETPQTKNPPKKTRKPKENKSERDKITRSEAIKLQCWECMGYQKKLISICPDVGCPLWTFRMGKQVHTDVPVRKPQKLSKKEGK